MTVVWRTGRRSPANVAAVTLHVGMPRAILRSSLTVWKRRASAAARVALLTPRRTRRESRGAGATMDSKMKGKEAMSSVTTVRWSG